MMTTSTSISTRSYYSSVSTPDVLIFDDSASSVESPKSLLNLPLTEENLKLFSQNLNQSDFFYEERMMKYINRQQYLTGLERKRQNENMIHINYQATSSKRQADEIWGIRKPIKGKIGFCGGHLGTRIVEESTGNIRGEKTRKTSKPLQRMFGRIALPFQILYKWPAHKITPLRQYDEEPQLIAIGYDEWEWHAT